MLIYKRDTGVKVLIKGEYIYIYVYKGLHINVEKHFILYMIFIM